MSCPHFADHETSGTTALCFGIIVPFKPSLNERMQYCETGLHQSCPLYHCAGKDLSLAIHQEVARAIG
ncbi:MAG: hypothetical protein EPO61_15445 [Nitrospirae bacterium]|nr:MAG: hypothetical protein EPO61_15445 [Nitrospirota bacterium]